MPDHPVRCGGTLKPTQTTYTQWFEGRLFVIEHVPAWECEQCGELFFDPPIVEQVQARIWGGDAPDRVIEAAVYDFVQRS